MKDLFDEFPEPELSQYGAIPVNRPSLGAAAAARDDAMAAVAGKAEEEAPGFAQRAKDFALNYLTSNGPGTAEDITDAAIAAGIRPRDLRAFGPVIMALARDGFIEKTGEVRPRRRGHATAGANVWRLVSGREVGAMEP
jgi:hypothetical protein